MSGLLPYNNKSTASSVAADLSSNIANKVVLTTGVSPSGLGASFVETIAIHKPALLILAGRSKSKLEAEAEKIHSNPESKDVPTRLLILDLSSQKQIREAANEVLSYKENIDVLVNNAGIMAVPYATTAEGLESTFGANHIGHFLFTNLIISKVLASPNPRIVSVSSKGHALSGIHFSDVNYQNGAAYNKWDAYGQSKTANILFAKSLVKKLGGKGLQAYSLHPGTIFGTSLGPHLAEQDFVDLVTLGAERGENFAEFDMKTLDEGTATHVVAAFDDRLVGHNGAYLVDANLAVPEVKKEGEIVRKHAWDDDNAEKLWNLSEEIVGQKFEY